MVAANLAYTFTNLCEILNEHPGAIVGNSILFVYYQAGPCIGMLAFFQQRQFDKFVGRNRRVLSASDEPAHMHCSALDFTFASHRRLAA